MRSHLILRVATKLLTPYIILYGLYVQFHGDLGPGGGFQAGVIVASAIVLYALIFGITLTQRIFKPQLLLVVAALGVSLYAVVGYVAMGLGGAYLDYDFLAADDTVGQHIGIIAVEFGVGLTVTAVMALIFLAYVGRTQETDDEEW